MVFGRLCIVWLEQIDQLIIALPWSKNLKTTCEFIELQSIKHRVDCKRITNYTNHRFFSEFYNCWRLTSVPWCLTNFANKSIQDNDLVSLHKKVVLGYQTRRVNVIYIKFDGSKLSCWLNRAKKIHIEVANFSQFGDRLRFPRGTIFKSPNYNEVVEMLLFNWFNCCSNQWHFVFFEYITLLLYVKATRYYTGEYISTYRPSRGVYFWRPYLRNESIYKVVSSSFPNGRWQTNNLWWFMWTVAFLWITLILIISQFKPHVHKFKSL